MPLDRLYLYAVVQWIFISFNEMARPSFLWDLTLTFDSHFSYFCPLDYFSISSEIKAKGLFFWSQLKFHLLQKKIIQHVSLCVNMTFQIIFTLTFPSLKNKHKYMVLFLGNKRDCGFTFTSCKCALGKFPANFMDNTNRSVSNSGVL